MVVVVGVTSVVDVSVRPTVIVPVMAIGALLLVDVVPAVPLVAEVDVDVPMAVAAAAESVATEEGTPVPVVPSADRSVELPRAVLSAGCSLFLQATGNITSPQTSSEERI